MNFSSMIGWAQILNYALSGVIVVQSVIARTGFIELTKLIKYTSESQRMRFILVSVFKIYFINYGILYVLVPLKIQIPLVSDLLVGVYYDFNTYWYTDIGFQVITLMVIQAFFPPIEFAYLWFWDVIKRSYNQGRCWRKKVPESTKSETLLGYKNLYCGPEFEIHYQYSNMLVITWVTFLFAPGIPILFPIALLGMIILYCTNRISLAYFNRRPPVYDQKMNKTTLKLLGVAPLLYICMGAWVYSNQQTFTNVVTTNKNSDLFMDSDHHFSCFWEQLTPGSVFLVYIFFVVVLICWRVSITFCKIERCFSFPMKIKAF